MTYCLQYHFLGVVMKLQFIGLGLLLSGFAHGYEVLSRDDFSAEIGGSFHYDLGDVSDIGGQAARDARWRRERLSFGFSHNAGVEFEAEYDRVLRGWTDLYLKIKKLGPGSLTIGQFKQFFGLEQLHSSKKLVFVERGLTDNTFGVARRAGIGYSMSHGRFGIQFSAFGRNLDDRPSSDGVGARVYFADQQSAEHINHFGLALTREQADGDRLSFSARPSTRLTDFRVARASLTQVQHFSRLGAEFAAVRGPWFWHNEWMLAGVERRGQGSAGDSFTGHAATTMLSYAFGGHSRSYKEGVFGAAGDEQKLFEIGARVDFLDLNDGALQGGESLAAGVVATYTFAPGTRIMVNAMRNLRQRSELDPSVIETRMQFAF
jgi:phosphate-selective porin OprO/OprP